MRITSDWVNASHSIGAPFGVIGAGFGMLGRYGFIMPNFESYPCQGKYSPFTLLENYDYLELHEKDRFNFMELTVTTSGKKYYFQQELLGQTDGAPADTFTSHAFLPFAQHSATFDKAGFDVEVVTWTPLIPHDLQESTVPALCMEIRLCNRLDTTAEFTLGLNIPEQTDALAAAFANGGKSCTVTVPAGDEVRLNAGFAWYYPDFITPSPMLTDAFRRYYTLRFDSAQSVLAYAMSRFGEWKEKISAWQDSFDIPSAFKRMWFASLSSVITSTMLSTEPMFFEIEVPHPWVNTMDVTIYSSWIYMINWPEIEKIDMYQFRKAIPTEGEDKGLVWHSLWDDRCDYVEEPCFITRIYRDYLWYNDDAFLRDMVEPVRIAFERVYGQKAYEGLIDTKHGNQSYDVWKMPGIATYVNVPWLYALHSIEGINRAIKADIDFQGQSAREILEQAKESFVKYLWNEEGEYFNCFYRTEGAREVSIPESVFTDQLFGWWLLLIEKDLEQLIPWDMVRKSLLYIYKNNLIVDPDNHFKGWSNGKLPDGVPCIDDRMYHVKTCWLSAQMNLASVLGELGYEEEMLDVFYSMEECLGDNLMALGEWNRSITPEGLSCPLPQEISKDTPRFPSIPRHKSCWELLVRLLGLKMDRRQMELKPMRSIAFAIRSVKLAGCELTVQVEKNWNTITVDGERQQKAVFDRNGSHTVIFTHE